MAKCSHIPTLFLYLQQVSEDNMINMIKKQPFITLFCLFWALLSLQNVTASTKERHVLIVSSYNPAAATTSRTIDELTDELSRKGQPTSVVVENLNCKSFTEAPQWKKRMADMFDIYREDNTPAALLLLGQEAWATYLSLDKSQQFKDVPVITSLASTNFIKLPSDSVSLSTWMPETEDILTDTNVPVKHGFLLRYNVSANINLIRHLYPDVENIAFISDNSYGGVTMQALVRKEMRLHNPDLNLILLDGRVNTVYSLCEKLGKLPPHTAILLGTWRVDMNESYFLRGAIHAMKDAAGDIPTFTMSTVGIGSWALGGISPRYRLLGKELADLIYDILNTPDGSEKAHIEVLPEVTQVDGMLASTLGIDIDNLPGEVQLVGMPPSFYEQYKFYIWIGVVFFSILLTSLLVVTFYYLHTKQITKKLRITTKDLLKAKEQAEESNRLKSSFLANMSHEIRTPLNAIVGFSDVLTSSLEPNSEQREYSDIIRHNSDLLLRLINDILYISRLESNSIEPKLEQCDVVKLCSEMISTVSIAYNNGNTFHLDCKQKQWYVNTDPQRLQQVIINLLTNANKFTKDGVISLSIEQREINADNTSADSCHELLFMVTDTGIGIPPEKHRKVFERFAKLDEFVQGTGLGLFICQLTVEQWGGRIWIDEQYTGGARFCFTHPV